MSSMIIKSEEIIDNSIVEYNNSEDDGEMRLLEDSGGEGYQTYQDQTQYQIQIQHISSPRAGNGTRTVVITPQQPQQQQQHINVSNACGTTNQTIKTGTPLNNNNNKVQLENEKRIRREIANSNERRRMQSINAGFQSLRSLLPRHEGEKLSKAAILQQTAQYIVKLEDERTRLLSQNSQLLRKHCNCDNSNGNISTNQNAVSGQKLSDTNDLTALKKRKIDVIAMQTISDSSDEGLGSMSPEPVTLITSGGIAIQTKIPSTTVTTCTTPAYISTSAKEINEMKMKLEGERKQKRALEERLRQLERQLNIQQQQNQQEHYIQHEVIEHTDNVREDELQSIIISNPHHQHQHHHHHPQTTTSLKIDPIKLQVLEIDSIPSGGQTQVVVCSSIDDMIQQCGEDDLVETEILNEDDMHEEIIINAADGENTEIVEVPSRLQPILEAAIKAEPKVEVERINATLTKLKNESIEEDAESNSKRMYLTSTSRQNLETIVEAIRHLEGDHLFGEEQHQQVKTTSPTSNLSTKTTAIHQDVPLALTTKQQQQQSQSQRNLTNDLSPFLQLKQKPTYTIMNPNQIQNNLNNQQQNIAGNIQAIQTVTKNTNGTTITITQKTVNPHQQQVQQQQIVPTGLITTQLKNQCRPGVIVAKQVS